MKDIENIEHELALVLDTIARLKRFREAHKGDQYPPCQSAVMGELRHTNC